MISYFNAAAIYTSVFKLTGSLVVVFPLIQPRGDLPIGIQRGGRRWHDREFLNVAEALTEITGAFRRPPGY